MVEPIESYVPQTFLDGFRRQAWKVWVIGLAVVALWVALIVGSPILKASGLTGVSSPLYHFFSFLCHQRFERSFHIFAEPFAVCSRCFGVYFGLFAGFAGYPFWRSIDNIEPPRRVWLFLSLFPIGIDWALTMFGYWENTHLSRFATGLILGIACAIFIVPALVEITRNFTFNRQAR